MMAVRQNGLEIHDVANPLAPLPFGTPQNIPSAAAIAIDSQRGLLLSTPSRRGEEPVRHYANLRALPEMTVDQTPPSRAFANRVFLKIRTRRKRRATLPLETKCPTPASFLNTPAVRQWMAALIDPFTIRTDPRPEYTRCRSTNLMGATSVLPVLGKAAFFVFAA